MYTYIKNSFYIRKQSTDEKIIKVYMSLIHFFLEHSLFILHTIVLILLYKKTILLKVFRSGAIPDIMLYLGVWKMSFFLLLFLAPVGGTNLAGALF